MNTRHPEQYGEGSYQTRRSEKYRHPERDTNYRFDDYGASARGGYGNESYGGTWGNQGNEMGGSRNVSGRGDTYSTSRNFGNMGSYGGSQGYGSSRGGYPSQRSGSSDSLYHYESGMGSGSSSGRRSYGYSSDYDSHGSGYNYDDNPEDLYGSDVSRRFQGSDQGRYNFDRDRSRGQRGMSDSSNYWDRDNYGSSNYGGSEGNYMGSGYNRSSRGSSMGDYGSMGSYDSGSSSSSRGSYSGGDYGSRQRHDPYARDTENTRIHHSDSDYDYDPNHAFDSRKKPEFMGSRNRSRTWNRDFDQDRHRDYDRF
ncbi:hypothetical protein [Pontibacter cellulosilyticus]|uniref:Uncharacterized protein n=1 Tax=Pontibacter cellulosilyticus TaxID=1720253 RepID=A0A923N2V4_9BACT|nr:hypothetical protein [Pontibacter cellulosilyticus]MBC5991233.1 hypothetical protein [Pontibacter cellulosilyticus]